jgi:glutathione S-transferase
MSLTLYFHPLSSFCMKALVGLYELDLPFTKRVIDLGNDAERAELRALWPMVKFPVLRDEARGVTVAESSLVLEYIDERDDRGGGARSTRLVPRDSGGARECRLRDRFFDLYVQGPMQKIVGDKLRPEDKRDAYGVEQAKAQLATAYAVVDDWMRVGPWALGDAFTMADCAAAPALFYAQKLVPFGEERKHIGAYFGRLMERPSFARTLEEAQPYMAFFPG